MTRKNNMDIKKAKARIGLSRKKICVGCPHRGAPRGTAHNQSAGMDQLELSLDTYTYSKTSLTAQV
jgi:hypothetical protein